MENEKTVDIAEYETQGGKVTLTKDIIKKYLVNGQGNVTDKEVALFIALCKFQKLNPFLKEAYLIKYGDNDPATLVVSKDVFVQRCAADPNFDGIESGVVVNNGTEILERQGSAVFDKEVLLGGWAIGYRKDWQKPVKKVLALKEYEGRKKDGQLNRQWSTKPGTMIVKCAEAQVRRDIVPNLNGLYSEEEHVPIVDMEVLDQNKELPPMPKAKTDTKTIEQPPDAEATNPLSDSEKLLVDFTSQVDNIQTKEHLKDWLENVKANKEAMTLQDYNSLLTLKDKVIEIKGWKK